MKKKQRWKPRRKVNTRNTGFLTFGEFRRYLAIIDRLSICMRETLQYENFMYIRDVPASYNKYYVYGVGQIESEFYEIEKGVYSAEGSIGDLVYLPCLEVMLDVKPRVFKMLSTSDKGKMFPQ